MKQALRELAHAAWDAVQRDPRATPQMRAARLPRNPRILGASTKILKGEKKGILTAIAYLSPARESGRDMCPWRNDACTAACLGHSSGQMVFDTSRNSRVWKTALFLYARHAFYALLHDEIRAHVRKAKRLNMTPAVRLNGTSDVIPSWLSAEIHPDVQFYDYTKSYHRAIDHTLRRFPANYHVTFSRSGDNDAACRVVLSAGGNVAVVFGGTLPALWNGYQVVDADETDARFMDPRGTVAGLSFKGNTDPKAAGAFVVASGCQGAHGRK